MLTFKEFFFCLRHLPLLAQAFEGVNDDPENYLHRQHITSSHCRESFIPWKKH